MSVKEPAVISYFSNTHKSKLERDKKTEAVFGFYEHFHGDSDNISTGCESLTLLVMKDESV